jgi:glycerophosphoryl diester phosphodiesterase
VADFVEVDVRMTRDGQVVVMHDTTLRRTTDVRTRFPHRAPWSVGDFTLAELRTLDAGSWFDARYAGAAVPTLQEVLGLLRGRAGLLLEVKAPALYSGMAEAVAAELDRPHSRATPVVVQSFDWDFMRELHRLAPGVPGGLLRRRGPRR